MNVDILVKYKITISDHDGYCSGSECELTTKEYKKLLKNIPELDDIRDYAKYADRVYTNRGSGYCNLNQEVIEEGLDRHDYNISVISAKIVKRYPQEIENTPDSDDK